MPEADPAPGLLLTVIWLAHKGHELLSHSSQRVVGSLRMLRKERFEKAERIQAPQHVRRELINLREDDDKVGPGEEVAIGDALPQHQLLRHGVVPLLLLQWLPETGGVEEENKRVGVLDRLNPLLPLRPRAPNVVEVIRPPVRFEAGHADSRRLLIRAKDIAY